MICCFLITTVTNKLRQTSLEISSYLEAAFQEVSKCFNSAVWFVNRASRCLTSLREWGHKGQRRYRYQALVFGFLGAWPAEECALLHPDSATLMVWVWERIRRYRFFINRFFSQIQNHMWAVRIKCYFITSWPMEEEEEEPPQRC